MNMFIMLLRYRIFIIVDCFYVKEMWYFLEEWLRSKFNI